MDPVGKLPADITKEIFESKISIFNGKFCSGSILISLIVFLLLTVEVQIGTVCRRFCGRMISLA